MKDRRTSFKVFKDGGFVTAHFEGRETFKPAAHHQALSADRIAAIDTESLKDRRGRLGTVLVPVAFHDSDVMIEPRKGESIMEQVAALLIERFGVPEGKPSQRRARSKASRTARTGRKDGRDGDRLAVPVALLCFYNLEYDLQRLFADRPDVLRAIAAGAESYRIDLSTRYELEVRRLHLRNGANFDWRIRDRKSRTISKIVGLDVWMYWRCTLGKATATFPEIQQKGSIEDEIPGLFERVKESLTGEHWELFRTYAGDDARGTRGLYLATVALLVGIDPVVIRQGGYIPFSAPGAAARIVFNAVWRCHPEINEWRRYPAWADRWGCRAYLGGNSFTARPGKHVGLQVADIASAFSTAMADLPDLVTCDVQPVRPAKGFKVEKWLHAYGVLEVDGEGLDAMYPAFRAHDGQALRYVVGRFEREVMTIPEAVMGVLSGALRIDRIRGGCVIKRGKVDRAFLAEGVRMLFGIKNRCKKGTPLYELAKILLNASYGKLFECNRGDFVVPIPAKVPNFTERERVADSIAKLFAEMGPVRSESIADLYWGESPEQQKIARAHYAREMKAKGGLLSPGTARATHAVLAYSDALVRAKVPAGGEKVSVREFMRRARRYTCGQLFFPLLAAQITGITSAKLALAARCLGAVCGDTDSIAFKPSSPISCNAELEELPEMRRYHAIVERAGYPSPRFVDGKWRGLVAGIEGLGIWNLETPTPSLESLVPEGIKRYSHLFAGGVYKQAFHGFANYSHQDVERILGDASTPKKERLERAGRRRKELLHQHMGALVDKQDVEFVQRAAPERLRRWAITGGATQPGEFRRRKLTVKTNPRLGTTLVDGIVKWNELTHEERGRRALANAHMTEEQRFAQRRDDLVRVGGDFKELEREGTYAYDEHGRRIA